MNPVPNALIHQTSPYLLQHAYNPVQWVAWSDQTLKLAQEQNKLILVSIGYSACHWCHVMEHESFENEEVAAIMNRNFICIKIDREERPDIDALYMDAVQTLTGSGGWPLNCFALPDGRPFWGGTYFPKDKWIGVLQKAAELWQLQPNRIIKQAEQLTNGIKEAEIFPPATHIPTISKDDIVRMYLNWAQHFDLTFGGTQRAPKFPVPTAWQFLLSFCQLTNESSAKQALQTTLNRMAWGGIYDHVGGGFARYSTDSYWLVPHFEKMLYDNAQLLSLYARAFSAFKEPQYLQVVEETVAFMNRELLSQEGAYFAALDADSEGVEGKFYCWKENEIDTILGDEALLYKMCYNITTQGNWEHGNNIIHLNKSLTELAKLTAQPVEALTERLKLCNQKLLSERQKRIPPGLDDKILTSWNALAITGLVDAYKATTNNSYLVQAQQIERFIRTKMLEQTSESLQLYRSWKVKPSIPAFLEDYALLIEAEIQLYQATFHTEYLYLAKELLEHVLQHFSDETSGMFWYTSDTDTPLAARKKELHDSVMPSSNAVMAHNLYTLSIYFYIPEWKKRAKTMLATLYAPIERHTGNFAHWAALMLHDAFSGYEIVICGPEADAYRAQLQKLPLPNCYFAGLTKAETNAISILQNRWQDNDRTAIYICKSGACELPVYTLDDALKLLNYSTSP